jgi:prolyl 4-hydroxylase
MGKFVFHTNRGPGIFRLGLERWGGVEFKEGDDAVQLLYFDGYGGRSFPSDIDLRFQLLERSKTIPLDHKLLLAKRLREHGMNYPRVYFTEEDVPADPAKFWYVKDPLSTAGKKVFLCSGADIGDFYKPGYLIQEAIQDVALIDGRKFTIRAYVLVHDRVVYFYQDSFLVVHGKAYDPGDLDPHIHYIHDGYARPGAEVKMLPSIEYAGYGAVMDAMMAVTRNAFAAFASELSCDDPSRYCIFGLDFLQTADGRVALVEINDRPNFVHTKRINEAVNSRMVEALLQVLMPEFVTAPLASRFHPVLRYGQDYQSL